MKRLRVPEWVSAREVEGETVLLDLEQGTFFAARGVGPRVWELIAQGKTIDEVVENISAQYDVDADRARADIEAFVGSLVEKSLVVEIDGEETD
ncbi:MAG: PqqD family protein [Actinomycetota bacterium]